MALRFDSQYDLDWWLKTRRRQPPTPRLVPTEDEEQATLIEWVRASARLYPELLLLHASANGGYRAKRTAARLRKTGVLSGVPDLLLPVARRGAHSLYVELKALDGHPSEAQLLFAREAALEGNVVAFAWGWEMARDTLLWYLFPAQENT